MTARRVNIKKKEIKKYKNAGPGKKGGRKRNPGLQGRAKSCNLSKRLQQQLGISRSIDVCGIEMPGGPHTHQLGKLFLVVVVVVGAQLLLCLCVLHSCSYMLTTGCC